MNNPRYTDVFVHRDVAKLRRRQLRRFNSDPAAATNQSQQEQGEDDFSDGEESDSSDGSSDKHKNNNAEEKNDGSGDSDDDNDDDGGDCDSCDFICIVMEYCAGGTLLDYVASGVRTILLTGKKLGLLLLLNSHFPLPLLFDEYIGFLFSCLGAPSPRCGGELF